ncbi:MAG TPA: methyltransferase domain-containing protein, partial [Solirubrobacteraceae bacterium]
SWADSRDLPRALRVCPPGRDSFLGGRRVARMEHMAFDEKVAAQLDAFYRTRDVIRRRELALAALDAQPADAVLDIGCGPGFYVAALAEQAASVTGIDPSASMLAMAARKTEGHRNVTLREGEATALPLDEASVDRALSVQVFEYIADIPAALAEIHRVVRRGGRVVLWDIDWTTLSWHADDAERMARMTQGWDRHLVHPALPRTLAAALRAAGFADVRCDAHVFCTTTMDPESFGGNLPTIIGGYLHGLDDIAEDDIAGWQAELRDLDARGAYYFALTQCCFSATQPPQRAE